MTKLEAWKTWSASAGAPGTEFTLEKSSHGKAFSYAWDAALAQPEQEPVLWEIWPRMGGAPYYSRKKPADTDYVEFTPLYAAPPQRKPLTEEVADFIVALENEAMRKPEDSLNKLLNRILLRLYPLTEEEINAISARLPTYNRMTYARAIERAHGIE